MKKKEKAIQDPKEKQNQKKEKAEVSSNKNLFKIRIYSF